MNDADDEGSFMANNEILVIQNVMISRYFTAGGLVIVLYDTILTIEDEVSGFWTRAFKLHLLFGGSPSLARAFRRFEATLLRQPVLDDCFLDPGQLSWVQALRKPFERLRFMRKDMAGFRQPLSTTVGPKSYLQLSSSALTYITSRQFVISVPSCRHYIIP